uniref:Uncharacterized protein n=1 Tax=Denticeps clupeoides TaxID=299321 RepID=A0A8C3ZL69_9TELE
MTDIYPHRYRAAANQPRLSRGRIEVRGHLRVLPGERRSLTGDLQHAILGLHHQLLRGEVVDVQADLPGVLGLLDLGHAAAELPGQGPGVGRVLGHHQRAGQVGDGGQAVADVAGPVAAGEGRHLLGEGGHAEGLVEDPAALVPVPERVPAGGAQEGEGHASLCHVSALHKTHRLSLAIAIYFIVP